MTKELLAPLTEQAQKMLAPVQALNQLAVDNAEKLVALQIASVQRNAALGFSQLRAALEVKDVEAFQSYLSKQYELVKSLGEGFAGDVKAVSELGNAFSAKVQELGKENMEAVTKATKKAA